MTDLEFFVEYLPNEHEGEQAVELTENAFLELITDHKEQDVEPVIQYDRFTVFENGRDGRRLTIIDEHGVFYC